MSDEPITDDDAPEIKPIPQLEEVGIPLLRAIWEQIKQDNSAWNQGLWIGRARGWRNRTLHKSVRQYVLENQAPPWDCGTAYCLAGHAALAKGARLRGVDLEHFAEYNNFDFGMIVRPNGNEQAVDDYAAEVLHLNYSQSLTLFGGGNSAYEIEAYICALEADPNTDLESKRYGGLLHTIRQRLGNETEWMVANGFQAPPPYAQTIRQAVECEFSYQSDERNEMYTLLVLTKGIDLTARDVYEAQIVLNDRYEDVPEYLTLPFNETAAYRQDAEVLRRIAETHRRP